jgi:leucyl/phenylalanyl-tRNA--protein transferase
MTDSHGFSKIDFLKPENMILLYSKGAFPMADEFGEINWYMPDIRTIIPLDNFNIPRSLKKYFTQCNFEFRFDENTIEIIKNCADRETTWISDKLIKAYQGLIKLGHLHSVEVFQNKKLVGGLYGVTYRGAFFGESMFSFVTQASKCALVKLIQHLNEKEFILLDVQYQTEHLKMFGAKEISLNEFDKLLSAAYKYSASFK